MKIKKYTATSTQQALRQVREEQGNDAVILCNRKTAEGIEIISATEFDDVVYKAIISDVTAIKPGTEARDEAEPAADAPMVESGGLTEIRDTLTDLRALVATQICERTNTRSRTDDTQQTLVGAQLRNLGFGQSSSGFLERELITAGTDVLCRRSLAAALQACVDATELLPKGLRRVVAVVGQTGVGKTTTIAKLAVAATGQGNKRLALVSADSERIGAHQQLSRLAELLDIPLFEARDNAELAATLASTRQYDHVLIDTAGRAPGDLGIESQLTTLRQLDEHVVLMLTLAANVQAGAVSRSLDRYRDFAPDLIALTKLDESDDAVVALNQIVAARIPLALLTSGQKIPDDLHIAAQSMDWLAARLLRTHETGSPSVTPFRSQGAHHVTV